MKVGDGGTWWMMRQVVNFLYGLTRPACGRRLGGRMRRLTDLIRTILCVLVWMVPACTKRDHGLRLVTVGGQGPPTLVLLHGFGSTAQDWLPFAKSIRVPGAKGQTSFIFPEGPHTTTPPEGPTGGRAWWSLKLASYIASPAALPDLSQARPVGLEQATESIRILLEQRRPRLWEKSKPLVLGGFSQGAIVSLETALGTKEDLAGLVLLSGTIVDEAHLVAALPSRRGLPAFVAHGRNDRVLPFFLAERLVHHMQNAGVSVTWFPFEGGHEIPAIVVDELNAFLGRTLPK